MGLSITVILVASVSGVLKRSLEGAKASRTLIEMRSILEAARGYYDSHGSWPVSMGDIESFFSKAPVVNSWGHLYQISHCDVRFSVDTEVPGFISPPAGEGEMVTELLLGNVKRWKMGIPLSYGRTARLVYEK